MSSDVGADESSFDSDVGETQSWRGCSMDEIHRHLNEFELEHVSPVRPSDSHTVLHHYPIRAADTEPPRPLRGHHKWDAYHVRLPCSAKSQYPVTAEDGNVSIESRWEMIEKALLRPIANSHELEAAILAYNSKYENQWKFRALHQLFEEDLDESEAQVFFDDLLPRIVRLALRLPELVQSAIPLLKQGQTRSVTLTQEQISCLLANAFLCTFPRRNTMKRKSEYSTFPDINFNRLFQSSGQCVLEKIKCICHYFRRVCPTEQDNSNVPCGVVTFARRSLHYSEMPNWSECRAPLSATPLHITSAGTIEDQGLGLLQVDFANKFLGGGVLGSGCVQEEIRFVICPELIISKLFTECLRPTEALLMVGCERYSNYSGYAGTFQWSGDHEDATPRDCSRRRQTHIVAIDALAFVQSSHQYREELMLRELNKAYVGFYHPLDTPAPGVASGNWGCGAFGGEATLKALIQLMACAITKRPLVYYTFGNEELRDAVYDLYEFLSERNVSVSDLWATLKKFHLQRLAPKQLYNFIYSCHDKQKTTPKKTAATETESPTRSKEQNRTPANQNQTPAKNNVNNDEESSPVTSKTAAHVDCSTTAATKCVAKKDAHQAQTNISQDLFASSSDEAEENDNVGAERSKITPTNETTTSKSQESTYTISSTESDEVQLANETQEADAEINSTSKLTPKASPSNAATTKTSPSSSTLNKRSEPRQRTLLEMLDQCYTDGTAAKRHKS